VTGASTGLPRGILAMLYRLLFEPLPDRLPHYPTRAAW